MFNKFSIKNGQVIKGGGEESKDTSFYALDKNTRPIPPYTYIIVFTDNRVYNQYDIYDKVDGLSLITWIEPVPFTTPLFIYQNKAGAVYCSFSHKPPSSDYNQIDISPIYVLTEKVMKTTIIEEGSSYPPGSNPTGSSTKTYFTPPKFLFRNYMGRIIPDINGEELGKIMKTNPRPKSLGEILEREHSNRTLVRIIIALVIILICLLVYTRKPVYT